jgi:O-antigen ligase
VRELTRELLVNARRILVRGTFAAAVAVGVGLALPLSWESVATLLPPERRTDAFHYRESRISGFRRMLESLRLKDRAHPIEVHCAILSSEETLRRLVDRLDLATRWSVKGEKARRKLERSLEVEAVEYGGIEIRVRTEDPELSSAISNAAAAVLQERLTELHHEGLEGESHFVRELLDDNIEEVNDAARELAAERIERGLVDPEKQEESLASFTKALSKRLADARTEAALAARKYGRDSARARDALARSELLALQTAGLPSLASGVTAERSEQSELKQWERERIFLRSLENQLLEAGSQENLGVRVLDPAIPAERPDRTPFVLSALLSFLAIPIGVFAGCMRRDARAALLAPGATGEGARLAARLSRFLDLLGALPLHRVREPLIVLGAAAFGLVGVRSPLFLAIPASLAFVVLLLTGLENGWLVLLMALPWAWDYMNWDLGFEIQVPTEPGIVLFTVLWGYAILRRGRLDIPRSPLVPLLILSLAWIAVGIVTSVAPKVSLRQFVATTGFVLVGSLFPIFEIRRLEVIERVLKIYIVSGALLSIYGLVQMIRSDLPLDRAAFFMGEGLLHTHGPFAAFIGYGLGPCLVYLLSGRAGRSTAPLMFAAGLMLIATVVSLTRAAWVSVAALLAVIALARLRHFLRRIVAPLAFASLVLIPAFVLSPRTSTAFRDYLERSFSPSYGSNSERLNRWQAGLSMFLDRPLTGVGQTAYEIAYEDYRGATFASQLSQRWMGAHSDVVRTAAEQGLPGLLLLIALVVVFYRRGYRLMTQGSTPALRRCAAAVLAGMFTYSVHGLLNEYWRLPKMTFTLFIFVGLLGALEQIERAAASRKLSSSEPQANVR